MVDFSFEITEVNCDNFFVMEANIMLVPIIYVVIYI